MTTSSNNKSFKLKPGEKLPKDMLDRLKQINQIFTKDRDFSKYCREIRLLFNISPQNLTEERKLFMAGFMEGEGSLNVSAKKSKKVRFGFYLDPEFNITQHVNGVVNLYLALEVFKTGRISYKNGSNATLVYKIGDRKSLQEKVIPFYNKHVNPYGSPVKVERFAQFSKLLELFDKKGHENITVFCDQMLPIWNELRMQEGQSNQTFKNLETARAFAKESAKKLQD